MEPLPDRSPPPPPPLLGSVNKIYIIVYRPQAGRGPIQRGVWWVLPSLARCAARSGQLKQNRGFC